jgi:hypothetical protein
MISNCRFYVIFCIKYYNGNKKVMAVKHAKKNKKKNGVPPVMNGVGGREDILYCTFHKN